MESFQRPNSMTRGFTWSLGPYPSPTQAPFAWGLMRLHVAKCLPNNMPHVHAMHSPKSLPISISLSLVRSVWILLFGKNGIKMIQEVWNHHLDGQKKNWGPKPFSVLIYFSHPPKKFLESMCAMFDATVIATFPRGTVDRLPAQQPKFKGYQNTAPLLPAAAQHLNSQSFGPKWPWDSRLSESHA